LALKIDRTAETHAASLHRIIAFLPHELALLTEPLEHPISPPRAEGLFIGDLQAPALLIEKPHAKPTSADVHSYDVIHTALAI
jgi:hypothetical protein